MTGKKAQGLDDFSKVSTLIISCFTGNRFGEFSITRQLEVDGLTDCMKHGQSLYFTAY